MKRSTKECVGRKGWLDLSSRCTSIEECSKIAVAFSEQQMHDMQSLASMLMSELNSMKVHVKEKILYEAYRSPKGKISAYEVKAAIDRATETEERARKLLSKITKDCNSYCKSMDDSCFLAVDFPSNIVAKGSIASDNDLDENIQVLIEVCLQEKALLPISPEDNSLMVNVKDAVGFMLSWPRDLVIRCAELEQRAVKKRIINNEKQIKQIEEKKENANRYVVRMENNNESGKAFKKRRDGERVQVDHGKKNEKHGKVTKNEYSNKDAEFGTEVDGKKDVKEVDLANVMEIKKDEKKYRKDEKKYRKDDGNLGGKVVRKRKMTRAQWKRCVRLENNVALKNVAHMVDRLFSKEESVKVQCEDALYGNESFAKLNWNDFEAVFTMDELSTEVITSYTMYLYEQIKNGRQKDHGICFMRPTPLSENIEGTTRNIANRLATRGNNHLVLFPFNPRTHWMLVVLDLKSFSCYYLDSLGSSISSHLKQTIERAMTLNNLTTKVHWVKTRCPLQPGSIECGYYMLKFMKEIVNEGVDILAKDYVGEGKVVYSDLDMDVIREDWAHFVENFIYLE